MAKKIVSLLLAGVMVLSMTACGSKGEEETKKQGKAEIVTEISEPIELQYWHSISNPIHLEVLENLVEEFNETVGKEKNISVVPTFNQSRNCTGCYIGTSPIRGRLPADRVRGRSCTIYCGWEGWNERF